MIRASHFQTASRMTARRIGNIAIILAAALGAGCATTPAANDPVQMKLNDIDARLTRIERVISNQSLVDLAQHLDALQTDVRQLRGRIEELEYKQESMRKQDRDLYKDLDKRIVALGGGSASTPSQGSATPQGPADSGASSGSSSAAAGGSSGSASTTGSGTSAGVASGAAGSAGPTTGSAGGAAPSEEQAVYSQSFDALKAGSYSVAITGFKDFLVNYPNSSFAENAQYWLGEAYYVTHDLEGAAGAFRNVVQKWPNSRKTPDALVKLGLTQLDQKKTADGRATLSQVVQKYPGTDAARLANERLERTTPK